MFLQRNKKNINTFLIEKKKKKKKIIKSYGNKKKYVSNFPSFLLVICFMFHKLMDRLFNRILFFQLYMHMMGSTVMAVIVQ